MAEGTISLAKARRLGSTSVMTRGYAPEARAAARARRPMGPAPQTTTGVPRVMGAELMPWRTTLRGSRRAPSAKETLSGSLGALSVIASAEDQEKKLTCEATWRDGPCIAGGFQRRGRRPRTGHLRRGCIGRRGRGSSFRRAHQAQQQRGHLGKCQLMRQIIIVVSLLTRLEVGDALAASNHNTSSLMSNDAVTFENERTDASRLPEVNIGTTTA